MAQFIYLLLNNQKVRDVIDTITSKVVLILGRFTSERKVILDALKDELRRQNYTPVLATVPPASHHQARQDRRHRYGHRSCTPAPVAPGSAS